MPRQFAPSMCLAEFPPEDVAELRERVGCGDEDAACGDPPDADPGRDPVLARSEARRHRDVGMVADSVGDGLLDRPGLLVEDLLDELDRASFVGVVSVSLRDCPQEPLLLLRRFAGGDEGG